MPTILVAQGYSITKSFAFTIVMQSGSLLGAIAAMYAIFAVAVQLAPETFGRSIEAEAGEGEGPRRP